MHKIIATLAIASAAVSAQAANTQAAALTVTKALSCDLAGIKAASVVKAVKALGARRGTEDNEYVLPSPLTVFGLEVTTINVSPSDGENPDTYLALFSNAKVADIAAAAKLKPLDRDLYMRDTRTGHLQADVRNHHDVWLSCIPK